MTDRPIRIGVQVANEHASYGEIRDQVRRLEDLGVDLVFNWDHFFPLSAGEDGRHFESWTMLAAIAEQTERIEFGPLVNCTQFRNADLQADMARTIDHISAKGGTGRFVFGTGAGWFEEEFAEYGYEFGTPGQRLDRLAADLDRYRTRMARLDPQPTRDIPILIGGKGEQKTLRIVAEHADIWHSFVPPEEYRHKLDVLAGWCERAGRDLAAIELSTGTNFRMSPADLVERRDAYLGLGVTLFEIAVSATDDLAPVRELLAWRDSVVGD